MEQLSDELLLESFDKAIELKLDYDFIALIKTEIINRGMGWELSERFMTQEKT